MFKSAFTFILILAVFLQKLDAQAPAGISGNLVLWLDASNPNGNGTLPAENASLTTWVDLSGTGHNATVPTGQNSAIFQSAQINGKPVLHFTRISDASGSVYRANGVDIRAGTNPDVTVFCVYRTGTHAAADYMGVWGDDNGNWDRFYLATWNKGTTGGISFGPASPYSADVPGAGTVGTARLLAAVYDGQVSGSVNSGPVNGSKVYFNGGLVTSFTDKTDPTAAQSFLAIGCDGDNSVFSGDIAEMIVYTRVLTLCEMLQVNKYLGVKYGQDFGTVGVTISSSNTYACAANPVTLTATSGGSLYEWLKNGISIASGTTPSFNAIAQGDYQVVKTNSQGCNDTSVVTTLSGCPDYTLPVRLIAFSVGPNAGGALLNWATADEQNFDRFIVQRSSDATNWKDIGTVGAAGTGTAIKAYSFSDGHPADGLNYYRLAMVDKDGSEIVGKTISLNTGYNGAVVKVSPNPTKGLLTVSGLGGNSRLDIIGIVGQVLSSTQTNGVTKQLDLTSYPSGTYILRIIQGGAPTENIKIVKQ